MDQAWWLDRSEAGIGNSADSIVLMEIFLGDEEVYVKSAFEHFQCGLFVFPSVHPEVLWGNMTFFWGAEELHVIFWMAGSTAKKYQKSDVC